MGKAHFKSGFVNIYGPPNAGKSTLLNALLGEKIAITTHKAQTTRNRIKGIYHTDNVQIVFSDTPGYFEPKYLLHHKMIAEIMQAKQDGDLSLLLIDIKEKPEKLETIFNELALPKPLFLVLNKTDKAKETDLAKWQPLIRTHNFQEVCYISAETKDGTQALLQKIITYLPEGQPFYEDGILSDQTERFIIAEFIREQIFLCCKEEIPYNTSVIVQSFKDKGNVIVILADIIAGREAQKIIILGKKGSMIKAISTASRKEIERFLNKKVFLDLSVKIKSNWRSDPKFLKKLGYL